MKRRRLSGGVAPEEVVAARDFLSTIVLAGHKPVVDVVLGQMVKTDVTPANSLFEHRRMMLAATADVRLQPM